MSYGALKPNQAHNMNTYVTHPWALYTKGKIKLIAIFVATEKQSAANKNFSLSL